MADPPRARDVALACADIAEGPQCVPVCPWDVIHIHPVSNKAFKCDLCGGNPACARFCPSGTLRY